MNFIKKCIPFILLVMLIITGCSSGEKASTSSNDNVKKIKVAYVQTAIPITYQDDKGNATGYDVEAMKLVDELLPDYEFEFVPTTDDDLLIGVENGKYNVGIKNAFYTDARAEKYIYPKENIGASNSGLIMRVEDKDIVHDLSDMAKLNKKLIPIAPQDAQYSLVQAYNKENPDNTLKIESSENFVVTEWPIWISEGRYDAWLGVKSVYTATIESEDGPFHNLKDKLIYNGFTATKTYPLFNKKEQAFADAYDTAVVKLKEEGKLNELLVKFLGEDTFKMLEENK
ncbi:MAG: transporter substrate-binding domain-containing protein [Bacillus sp. (in: firmicutes)]